MIPFETAPGIRGVGMKEAGEGINSSIFDTL
jgi:hypothetical protein